MYIEFNHMRESYDKNEIKIVPQNQKVQGYEKNQHELYERKIILLMIENKKLNKTEL